MIIKFDMKRYICVLVRRSFFGILVDLKILGSFNDREGILGLYFVDLVNFRGLEEGVEEVLRFNFLWVLFIISLFELLKRIGVGFFVDIIVDFFIICGCRFGRVCGKDEVGKSWGVFIVRVFFIKYVNGFFICGI